MADEKPTLVAGPETKATETAVAQAVKMGGKEYASMDEAVKAYESLQSEYGKATQQAGDLKKQYDDTLKQAQQWNQWWQTVSPLWDNDVEELLRNKLAGKNGQTPKPTTHTPAQVTKEPSQFDGFDVLRPEEQAARLQHVVAEQMQRELEGRTATLAKQMQDYLAQKEQWYQSYLTNHLSLMRRALEEKLKNPAFDVDATMEAAANAIGGKIDPIQLGQQLLDAATFQARLEQVKKESYELGKKDKETEFANKKQEVGPMDVGAPKYIRPTAPAGVKTNMEAMRDKAAEALVKKFGSGLFSRE